MKIKRSFYTLFYSTFLVFHFFSYLCFAIGTKRGRTVPFSIAAKEDFFLTERKMTVQEIKNIVEKLLEGSDLFLVEIKISGNEHIEIIIDSANGVKIDKCAQVNREMNEILDKVAADYSLTVSSAGIGYPFLVPEQFLKNIGKTVELSGKEGTKIQGTLLSFNGREVVIAYEEKRIIEGKKKKELVALEKTVDLEDIKQIKEIISFK